MERSWVSGVSVEKMVSEEDVGKWSYVSGLGRNCVLGRFPKLSTNRSRLHDISILITPGDILDVSIVSIEVTSKGNG